MAQEQCVLCGQEADPKYLDHWEEHKDIDPSIYKGLSANRARAKRIMPKADELIPGTVDLCAWCHAALHGKQWNEGVEDAWSN